MRSVYLPLLLITAVLAVTGIEVFQVSADEQQSKVAETIFVVILASFFLMGTLIAAKRSAAIKAGLAPDDELSKRILHRSASCCFFISLVFWVVLLAANVHTNIQSRYLFSYGLLGMSFLFVLIWSVSNLTGLSHD